MIFVGISAHQPERRCSQESHQPYTLRYLDWSKNPIKGHSEQWILAELDNLKIIIRLEMIVTPQTRILIFYFEQFLSLLRNAFCPVVMIVPVTLIQSIWAEQIFRLRRFEGSQTQIEINRNRLVHVKVHRPESQDRWESLIIDRNMSVDINSTGTNIQDFHWVSRWD